jgi:hypothetical protein
MPTLPSDRRVISGAVTALASSKLAELSTSAVDGADSMAEHKSNLLDCRYSTNIEQYSKALHGSLSGPPARPRGSKQASRAHLENRLLGRVIGHEPVYVALPGLAVAPNAGHRLPVHRRVPVAIHHH